MARKTLCLFSRPQKLSQARELEWQWCLPKDWNVCLWKKKKKTCIQQKLGDGLWLLIFLWILADPYFICGGSMLSVWLWIWIQKLWISNMRHWRTTQELKQSELSSELLLDCILGLMTIIGFLGKKGHRHKQEQRRRERERVNKWQPVKEIITEMGYFREWLWNKVLEFCKTGTKG